MQIVVKENSSLIPYIKWRDEWMKKRECYFKFVLHCVGPIHRKSYFSSSRLFFLLVLFRSFAIMKQKTKENFILHILHITNRLNFVTTSV